MKPIIIRKQECGHWQIFNIIWLNDETFLAHPIFHGSWADILLIMNCSYEELAEMEMFK